jgi:hypothetical protein
MTPSPSIAATLAVAKHVAKNVNDHHEMGRNTVEVDPATCIVNVSASWNDVLGDSQTVAFANEIQDSVPGWVANTADKAATVFRPGCWTMRAARQRNAPIQLVRPERQPAVTNVDESSPDILSPQVELVQIRIPVHSNRVPVHSNRTRALAEVNVVTAYYI